MALGDMIPRRRSALPRPSRADRPFSGFGFRRDIESLYRDMDRLFSELWSEAPELSEDGSRPLCVPQVDLVDDDNSYCVKVDLPGIAQKDIEITLSDHTLTIKGEKQEEKELKEKEYYQRERVYGAFRRSIELPAAVDQEKVSASFRDGVLTIELPKSEQAQERSRRIEIQGK